MQDEVHAERNTAGRNARQADVYHAVRPLKRAKLAEINNDDDDGDVPEAMSEAEDATQSSSYGDAMTQIEGCTQIARNFGHKNFHRKELRLSLLKWKQSNIRKKIIIAKRANPMSQLPM